MIVCLQEAKRLQSVWAFRLFSENITVDFLAWKRSAQSDRGRMQGDKSVKGFFSTRLLPTFARWSTHRIAMDHVVVSTLSSPFQPYSIIYRCAKRFVSMLVSAGVEYSVRYQDSRAMRTGKTLAFYLWFASFLGSFRIPPLFKQNKKERKRRPIKHVQVWPLFFGAIRLMIHAYQGYQRCQMESESAKWRNDLNSCMRYLNLGCRRWRK